MEDLTFLREVLGNLYVLQQQEDIVFNYSFLINEKKSTIICNHINRASFYFDWSFNFIVLF